MTKLKNAACEKIQIVTKLKILNSNKTQKSNLTPGQPMRSTLGSLLQSRCVSRVEDDNNDKEYDAKNTQN